MSLLGRCINGGRLDAHAAMNLAQKISGEGKKVAYKKKKEKGLN